MADLITLANLRGGRNGFDPPHLIADNQVAEAVNVDWYGAGLARRRGGTVSVSLTGGTASTGLYRLFRFQPGKLLSEAELWQVTNNGGALLFKRLAAGTSWADVTNLTGVSITTAFDQIEATGLDGRFYIAAYTNTDRMMVYDPTLSSPGIRYVGFTNTPSTAAWALALGSTTVGPPTMANTGGGTYAAVLRTYRVRFVQKDGARIVRRSEYGEWKAFTPSGAGTAARITRPTALSEGETHWEVEVSYKGGLVGFGGTSTGPFYRIAQIAIATTTYDDSYTLDQARSFTLSEEYGFYNTWPNVQFIISDGNRLLGAGTQVTGGKSARVYFSAVLGSTDQGDAERVPNNTGQRNYLDLNENDGGGVTGLAPSLNGSIYAFKRQQIWRLIPTGDSLAPYIPHILTRAVGSINQGSIISARDSFGNPALYFWSEEGPCRLVVQGDGSVMLQYLGEDLRDLLSFPPPASDQLYGQRTPCALYYPSKHQVWMWFLYKPASTVIPILGVFDIMQGTVTEGQNVRGGWSLFTDFSKDYLTTMSFGASSCVMFSKVIAASMGDEQVPYAGIIGPAALLRCDTTDTTDNGQNFQAYIRTKPLNLTPFGENVGIGVSSLLADPAAGVTITQSLIRDYGLETRTSTVSLTAAASETKVIRKFEDSDMSGAGTVQVQIGDSATVAATQWKLHELAITVFPQEPR